MSTHTWWFHSKQQRYRHFNATKYMFQCRHCNRTSDKFNLYVHQCCAYDSQNYRRVIVRIFTLWPMEVLHGKFMWGIIILFGKLLHLATAFEKGSGTGLGELAPSLHKRLSFWIHEIISEMNSCKKGRKRKRQISNKIMTAAELKQCVTISPLLFSRKHGKVVHIIWLLCSFKEYMFSFDCSGIKLSVKLAGNF